MSTVREVGTGRGLWYGTRGWNRESWYWYGTRGWYRERPLVRRVRFLWYIEKFFGYVRFVRCFERYLVTVHEVSTIEGGAFGTVP